jgi:hypothetical protein
VGEYCYVCEDNEPFAVPMDRRRQGLIHKSDAWGGLRVQLAELQSALGDPDAARKPEIFKDLWKAVDEQVYPGKYRLRC